MFSTPTARQIAAFNRPPRAPHRRQQPAASFIERSMCSKYVDVAVPTQSGGLTSRIEHSPLYVDATAVKSPPGRHVDYPIPMMLGGGSSSSMAITGGQLGRVVQRTIPMLEEEEQHKDLHLQQYVPAPIWMSLSSLPGTVPNNDNLNTASPVERTSMLLPVPRVLSSSQPAAGPVPASARGAGAGVGCLRRFRRPPHFPRLVRPWLSLRPRGASALRRRSPRVTGEGRR